MTDGQHSSDDIFAHQLQGDAYKAKKQFKKALEEYEKALAVNPMNPILRCSIGECYFHIGQLDQAILTLHKVTQINPQDAEAHSLLGVSYYEVGLISKAIDCCKKAIHLSPQNSTYYNNLGVAYAEKGELDLAVETYKEALKINKGDAVVYTNLGVIYHQLGNEKEAKEAFHEAMKLDPNEITAHYCLGMEYEHKGEVEIGDVIRIGELLKIHPQTSMKIKDYTRIYKVRVEDISDDTITVSAPITNGTIVPMRRGMRLILGISKEDALYGFYTEIVDRRGGQVPVLVVKRSPTSRRIQRRRYVRINGEIPIELKIVKWPDAPAPAPKLERSSIYEKNISGGGMLIVTKEALKRGTMLQILMEFPAGRVKVMGEVRRVQKNEETEQYEVGVAFLDLNEKDRDKVVKYVYNRQIEMKRKGF